MNNIEILKKIIKGESKYHTKTTVGFSDIDYVQEKQKKREIGDIWPQINAKGEIDCWWEQKDGYKLKYNIHPELSKRFQEVRDELNTFPNCPKETCTCTIPKPIDIKFRVKTGMCEDCTISYETKLKLTGKFNEYAVEKMRNNALAFFKDADKEVEEIKNQIENISYITSDGEVEKWTSDNYQKFKDRIDEQYLKFKEDILNLYGGN